MYLALTVEMNGCGSVPVKFHLPNRQLVAFCCRHSLLTIDPHSFLLIISSNLWALKSIRGAKDFLNWYLQARPLPCAPEPFIYLPVQPNHLGCWSASGMRHTRSWPPGHPSATTTLTLPPAFSLLVHGNSILLVAQVKTLDSSLLAHPWPRSHDPENTVHPVFAMLGAPLLCGKQQPCSLPHPIHQHLLFAQLSIYSKTLTIS